MEQLKKQKVSNSYRRNQLLFVWGWLAIPIIAWAIFYWYVNFSSFVGAFQNQAGEWSMESFAKVWESIFYPPAGKDGNNTLAVAFLNTSRYFALNIFVQYPIQIFVCYFLYKRIFGYKFFRYVFYFPAIISGVVLIGVFKAFIEAPRGPIAQAIQMIDPSFVMPSAFNSTEQINTTLMIYVVWTCACGNMLLLCGAMNRIPIEVLEAARLDGIGPWREIVNLVLPLIWPTLSTLLILTCTGFLSASGPLLLFEVDIYTHKCTTISHWIWMMVYDNKETIDKVQNEVCAAGLLLTAVAVPAVLGIRKLLDLVPQVEY